MRILRFILFPFALLYGLAILYRNLLYRIKVFKSTKFSLPIISTGNLSMGGTGKTPHTEYLIRLLKDQYQVATMSRGFGRKVRGFQIADDRSTARSIGDEPLQYYLKFGKQIKVVVEVNRVLGVMDLCREHPETQVILLDDAYQHRAIHRGLNILLTTYDQPFYSDFILPVGNLREFRSAKARANVIIMSKCPELNEKEKTDLIAKIAPTQDQKVFFSSIEYGNCTRFDRSFSAPIKSQNIVLVTGIANADPLIHFLEEGNKILHHCKFPDHHNFSSSDLLEIHNIFDKFTDQNPVFVTTEKDAMRLMDDQFKELIKRDDWYYQEIKIVLDKPDEFNQLILDYVEKYN